MHVTLITLKKLQEGSYAMNWIKADIVPVERGSTKHCKGRSNYCRGAIQCGVIAPATVVNDALVLDDYHFIHSQAIHELMNELVRHPPRTLHLVIASRHDPALPLAGLRARSHVIELRQSDLCFTLEEAEPFLLETMALPVDKEIIATLKRRTEGWPVGLRLAALSLRQQHRPDVFVAKMMDGTLSGNRYIVDYLVNEVGSRVPGSIQDYLVQTSILDLLYGPLCEAVTGLTG